ncbi:MAG: hypothetical protein ACI93R_002307 [Flavobacteriales bacterium]|jgi:hypothetical protein
MTPSTIKTSQHRLISLLFLALSSLSACHSNRAPVYVDTAALASLDLNKRAQTATDTKYRELVQSLTLGEEPRSSSRLRDLYRQSSYYSPADTSLDDANRALIHAIEDGDVDLCSKLAHAILQQNYTELYAHYAASYCSKVMMHDDLAVHHQHVLDGLMNSIKDSGDGRSIDTAIELLSLRELRAFLDIEGYSAQDKRPVLVRGKNILEVIAVSNAGGKSEIFYFDLSSSILPQMY